MTRDEIMAVLKLASMSSGVVVIPIVAFMLLWPLVEYSWHYWK